MFEALRDLGIVVRSGKVEVSPDYVDRAHWSAQEASGKQRAMSE